MILHSVTYSRVRLSGHLLAQCQQQKHYKKMSDLVKANNKERY